MGRNYWWPAGLQETWPFCCERNGDSVEAWCRREVFLLRGMDLSAFACIYINVQHTVGLSRPTSPRSHTMGHQT